MAKTTFRLKSDAELAAERAANPPVIQKRDRVGMRVTEHGNFARLQVGMVIEISGEEYRVEMVNECRARCVPLAKQKKIVKIKDKFDESKSKEFEAEVTGAFVSISPNSDVPIIRSH